MKMVQGLYSKYYCVLRFPEVVMKMGIGVYIENYCIRRFPDFVMKMALALYSKIIVSGDPRSRNENGTISVF